jgi:hypothetical protein
METLPALCHYFGRERHDDPPVLFKPKAEGDAAAGTTMAERRVRPVEALISGGNLSSGVKTITICYAMATECIGGRTQCPKRSSLGGSLQQKMSSG